MAIKIVGLIIGILILVQEFTTLQKKKRTRNLRKFIR